MQYERVGRRPGLGPDRDRPQRRARGQGSNLQVEGKAPLHQTQVHTRFNNFRMQSEVKI